MWGSFRNRAYVNAAACPAPERNWLRFAIPAEGPILGSFRNYRYVNAAACPAPGQDWLRSAKSRGERGGNRENQGTFPSFPMRDWMQASGSGGDFPEDIGVEFGQADQCFRRAAWRPAPLLPLLQGPLGNSEQRGELRLRQSRFQTCADHGRPRLRSGALAEPGLDIPSAVQDFLPDIAFPFESGERASHEFLSHSRRHP